jgi:hypothetical protein
MSIQLGFWGVNKYSRIIISCNIFELFGVQLYYESGQRTWVSQGTQLQIGKEPILDLAYHHE